MTATAPITIITTTENNPWAENLAAQKTRFPNAKDSILFAIAALQDNPDIAIDDLKALASQQGIRVTAASVNAAKRLIDPEHATSPVGAPVGLNPVHARERVARRVRAAETPLDANALIQDVVAKIQAQGNAEAERMREAVRKATASAIEEPRGHVVVADERLGGLLRSYRRSA
jgi:hypothetical protein